MRLSRWMRLTAHAAAWPSFSLDAPMYEMPLGDTKPPESAKCASLWALSSCITPISSRMRIAGVHTASPQYLSRPARCRREIWREQLVSGAHLLVQHGHLHHVNTSESCSGQTFAPPLLAKYESVAPEGPAPTTTASNAPLGSVPGAYLPLRTLPAVTSVRTREIPLPSEYYTHGVSNRFLQYGAVF